MATTTNYGWTTPDDTALVKDGASAIRTLGSSVDTTVKNLNPETTLGDISYRSSTANTNTRLAIGTTGQVLTVSGGVPTWATASSGGMTLLSTTTLSGATTTVSGISGSYKDLQVVAFGFTNDTANGLFRIAPNGTTNISSWAMACNQDPAVLSRTNGYIDTFTAPLRTSTANTVVINIFNYADTDKNKAFSGVVHVEQSGPTIQGGTIGGIIKTTSAITSLVFSSAGGNLSGGTVLIYGVK